MTGRPPSVKPISRSVNRAGGGWGFCGYCGKKMAFSAPTCPECGAPNAQPQHTHIDVSEKSYSVAVTLCGIFGIVGVHHFYIGNILHGLFDLGLFIVAVSIYATSSNPNMLLLATALFVVDIVHSLYIFYRLITGQQQDGDGKLILSPGQRAP